jgi:hypothetical protein
MPSSSTKTGTNFFFLLHLYEKTSLTARHRSSISCTLLDLSTTLPSSDPDSPGPEDGAPTLALARADGQHAVFGARTPAGAGKTPINARYGRWANARALQRFGLYKMGISHVAEELKDSANDSWASSTANHQHGLRHARTIRQTLGPAL